MHRLRAMGIRDRPIAPGSPWQNGFAERLIGSIRRECVDHVVVLGEAHLRRILTRYSAYYNELRTHRSLDKDAPIHRAIQHTGRVISVPILGGFITIIAESDFWYRQGARKAEAKQGDIFGLLRITARHTAPTLSGIALLYRLAGLYRLARTREEQNDYANALVSYQQLMRETISALNDARTDPVTANVERLATLVPNYIIECGYKSFKRGSIDRIFTLAVGLTVQGYPPLYHLRRVISELVSDTRPRVVVVASKRRFGRETTEVSRISNPAKIDGLNKISQELTKLLGADHDLTRYARRAARLI
jgi:Integrase core domain